MGSRLFQFPRSVRALSQGGRVAKDSAIDHRSPMACLRTIGRTCATRVAVLWDGCLGRRMTYRLTRALIPQMRWNQEIYGRLLTRYVIGTTRWLDAGCGRQLLPAGLESIAQTLAAKPCLLVGVDLDFEALRSHQMLRSVLHSSLDAIPIGNESLDLVTCNMVVEHLPDPATALQEISRTLRPGGVLIVHTPNLLNYTICMARVLKAILPRRVILTLIKWSDSRSEENVFHTFYRANTRAELRRVLQQEGLHEEVCHMLVGPQPACSFFAPVALIELFVMRALLFRPFRPFATTILATYRKGRRVTPAVSSMSTKFAALIQEHPR